MYISFKKICPFKRPRTTWYFKWDSKLKNCCNNQIKYSWIFEKSLVSFRCKKFVLLGYFVTGLNLWSVSVSEVNLARPFGNFYWTCTKARCWYSRTTGTRSDKSFSLTCTVPCWYNRTCNLIHFSHLLVCWHHGQRRNAFRGRVQGHSRWKREQDWTPPSCSCPSVLSWYLPAFLFCSSSLLQERISFSSS